jgi:hypothetical protein
MSWYVFALVESLAGNPGAGLQGRLAARRVPGGLVILERRADVPPAEFGTLQKHDAVVARLARDAPAILPVRFGTLMEWEEITQALEDRDEEIADAFARVRGRVQFTWRVGRARGLGAEAPRAQAAARGAPGAAAALTGAEYLRRAARAAKAVPPAALRNVHEKLRSLTAAERYQAATPSIPGSLYHLVDRTGVERYAERAGKLASGGATLRVSGPFPPFAFTPELL